MSKAGFLFRKRTAVMGFAALLLLSSYVYSKEDVITVQGMIEDSQCAFNVHAKGRSHELMMKSGLAGAHADEKQCTLHCVKDMGGSYVLATKTEVYRLDDQVTPEQFAGEKVKVTGTLDPKTNTIHVQKIERDQDTKKK